MREPVSWGMAWHWDQLTAWRAADFVDSLTNTLDNFTAKSLQIFLPPLNPPIEYMKVLNLHF